jgi:nicotinamide mononucleotide transporter
MIWDWIFQNKVQLFSTLLGLLGVWLNIRISIFAWPIGIISVFLASWVYFEERLFAEFGLQFFYAGSGVYGWIKWSNKGPEHMAIPVSRLSESQLFFWLGLGLLSGLGIGYFLLKNTSADFPYLDAMITGFSLVGQIWLARKYLENWILWMLVNLVSMGLYAAKGLWFFLVLYLVLFGMAISGYQSWKRILDTPSAH